MKLIIHSLIIAGLCSPLAFADDCKKCDKDKKKEETVLAEKCKKKCDKDEDPALLADKCKKCDKDKEEETLLA